MDTNKLQNRGDENTQNKVDENTRVNQIKIDNAIYEVRSIYGGKTSLVDLFKRMLKRDIDMSE